MDHKWQKQHQYALVLLTFILNGVNRMDVKRTSDGLSIEQYEELCQEIKKVVHEKSKQFENDSGLKKFLEENPFPVEENSILSNVDRIYFLLLNRIKNWVAREQSKRDGGSYWKKKLRKNPECVYCFYCNTKFKKSEDIAFHHTARDGRRPIPMHKKCHDQHHQQTALKIEIDQH